MSRIEVRRDPDPAHLRSLGVEQWPVWEKDVSEFPWTYDATETCYIIEGEASVTPQGGMTVLIGRGDLVTFPAGMSCTWKIRRNIRKHYSFSCAPTMVAPNGPGES
jgi:uncharacterized cupin superfamily protein